MSDMMEGQKKTIKMFDGPGPGKKQCPKCKSYVGVRNSVCRCGHEWTPKGDIKENVVVENVGKSDSDKVHKISRATPLGRRSTSYKKRELFEEPKVIHTAGCGPLSTPGGPSLEAGLKVKLQSIDLISEWADKLVNVGRSQGFDYGPLAIRYFLRYYFDINSTEYKEAVMALNQWSTENNSSAAENDVVR